ncbi:MAG TPA: hypothetical protein VHM01_00255 [Alphaproteobacteria bacterium]|nr:hypothetical protein [Alphaproteobacteria bacterium]
MPQNSLVSRAEKTIESSPWVVPGALMGAYALTRLPFGLLTGLVIGFAAGWTLRAEQEGSGRSKTAMAGQTSEAQRAKQHEREEEKVDDMVDNSFPASDPPSYTAARSGKPKKT